MNERNLPCEERIDKELAATLATIRQMWNDGEPRPDPDGCILDEYGLCLDLVEAGTFTDQPEPYARYQLSWGGPSDEFRIYSSRWNGYRVDYWYLDWFDGAHRQLGDEDRHLILDVINYLNPELLEQL